MKIAFVHNYCKDFREEFFRKLDQKYDIDFFFLKDESTNLTRTSEIKSKYIPYMSDFHYTFNLDKLLNKKEYDIFISTDLGYHITRVTYEFAKKRNKKFILWNEQWKDILHPRRIIMKPYENKIVKNSNAILAFGKKAEKFVHKRGADLEKIVLAPNSLSKNMVPKSDEYYYKNYNKGINVLCLGRLIPVKGQDYLIRAFNLVKKEFNDIELIIAGSGPMEDKLKKLVKKLKINDVIIPGEYVKKNEKWNLYNNADIVVLPSVYRRHAEAWGLVINEAAFFSKPLVTTNMTGVSGEIVKDNKSGFIVPQKNVKSMADAILKLAKDNKLRKKMGEKANEIVLKEYKLSDMVKAFDRAIKISLT